MNLPPEKIRSLEAELARLYKSRESLKRLIREAERFVQVSGERPLRATRRERLAS